MQAKVRIDDEEVEPDDVQLDGFIIVSFRWEVCGTCSGRGQHVNPSIDSHGISSDEFDEDPDFREAYFSGAYDVSCAECHGKRVVPVTDDPRVAAIIKDNYQVDAIQAAERRMGA